MTKMEIHYAEEWAALYVDGKLDRQGSTEWVEERAFELAGILQVQDDAFLRGGTGRDETAKTLAEVADYAGERAERRNRAAELRAEADRLAAEAKALEAAK